MGGGEATRNSSGLLQRIFEVQSQWFIFAKVIAENICLFKFMHFV